MANDRQTRAGHRVRPWQSTRPFTAGRRRRRRRSNSLTYEVQTDDIYEDMKSVAEEMFDSSDYPTTHPLYSETNKKRVGCWKDENSSGSPISEFVGLWAKLYSISSAMSNKVKAKGNFKIIQDSKVAP